MAEPIAELIARVVESRMDVYTSAFRSTAHATWQPKDLVVHVFQGDLIKNEELSYPGNPPAQAWDMPVTIAGIVKPSDSETTPVDTFKNRLGSEIIKAITTGVGWYTFGGNAFNTTIGTIQDYTADDGSSSGVKVELLIQFRTSEFDPTSQR